MLSYDIAQDQIHHLDRPDGRIAYELAGDGPLVVLVPGMGDLRGTYRLLAPAIAEAGYRWPPPICAGTARATPPSAPTAIWRPPATFSP